MKKYLISLIFVFGFTANAFYQRSLSTSTIASLTSDTEHTSLSTDTLGTNSAQLDTTNISTNTDPLSPQNEQPVVQTPAQIPTRRELLRLIMTKN